ncbi:opacity protein [Spongiibacter sp. IMCC21906]|uniref:outer membrane beta-barrel protein n=1 Tax=Spongiibacter sp. IMCC21906 TaxID=1620392 RepID=UPI00062DF386|nr:outer membrane beta-barrel protein [Spongiibacter sp. IMCC21906]AKH70016.1 opacity protein [Spongiibacter sp. IMCC21906]
MMSSSKLKILTLLTLTSGSIALAPVAMAAPEGPHLYVGGNYGGYKDRGGDFDEDDDFKEALVGLQFNSFIAVEAGYLDFGSFGGDIGKADIDGYDIAVVGRLPLSERFGLFAKVGQLFWDADVNVGGLKESYDGDEPFVGIGADFHVTDNLAVALEYDRYEVDLEDSSLPAPATRFEGDMDTVKLGARFAF